MTAIGSESQYSRDAAVAPHDAAWSSPDASANPPGSAMPRAAAGVPRAAEAPAVPGAASASCRVRAVLDRIGDKWAIYVVDRLGAGPRRFTELLRAIDGVTARMLTVTLRGMERDGLVTRTVHAAVPPRVVYELTPLGRTLLDTIGQLAAWADAHLAEIEAARARYDAKSCPDEAAGRAVG